MSRDNASRCIAGALPAAQGCARAQQRAVPGPQDAVRAALAQVHGSPLGLRGSSYACMHARTHLSNQ